VLVFLAPFVGEVLLEALPSIERWLLGSSLRRP
jgi:hypothetical protein